MSDFEGDNVAWNSIHLSSSYDRDESSRFPLADPIQPRDPALDESVHKRGKRHVKRVIHKGFHPVIQNIRPRADRSTGGRPAEGGTEKRARTKDLDAYKSFETAREDPDALYNLDISWGQLLRAVPSDADHGPRQVAQRDLENIMLMTEAYINTPSEDSTKIDIWGTKGQCLQAKKQLRAWEQHLRSTGTRPSQKTWTKMPAYDGRKEDRKRQEYFQDLTDKAFNELDDDQFGYEAYLVWPEHFDLKGYLDKFDPEILREISRSFHCRFLHETAAMSRFTRLQAQSQDNLLGAYGRLINLVKEMMTLKYRGTHGNFLRLPSVQGFRDRISVAKDPVTTKFRAQLVGGSLMQHEWDQWSTLMKNMDSLNRKEFISSIDSLLRSLHMSQSHVRLRVDFGDVLLHAFTKPKDGYSTYLTDDFLKMIQNSRTELSDPILCSNQQDLYKVAEMLSSTEQFHRQKQTYRQIFDFEGTDPANRLRLEIELEPGFDVGEAQEYAHRWLKFKAHDDSTENILGLKVFDLEKPGFMIRVNAFALDTNEGIAKELDTFKSNISFEPSQGPYARLQSSFSKNSKLLSVVEVTAINFSFKNTDGTVELRREDTYPQQAGQASRLPRSSKLALSYYYREWDNLLGDFANKKPGEDVDWHRGLATFFPEVYDPDQPASLPKSFKGFMKELHEIQVLLRDVLSKVDTSEPTTEEELLNPE